MSHNPATGFFNHALLLCTTAKVLWDAHRNFITIALLPLTAGLLGGEGADMLARTPSGESARYGYPRATTATLWTSLGAADRWASAPARTLAGTGSKPSPAHPPGNPRSMGCRPAAHAAGSAHGLSACPKGGGLREPLAVSTVGYTQGLRTGP
eukprot:scaffold32292_cov71-Phaeocystis_antarctica.AAC.1